MIIITREQAKDLRNAFQCWQQDYDPVEDKEQYNMFGLGMVAMDALLASLEAEKSILYRERNPYNGLTTGWQELTDDEYEFIKDNAGENAEFRTVYTAPPATVSVPDAYSRDERGRMMLNGTQEPRIGYSAGWNACRDAMLQGAEPVSTAYKLPANVIDALEKALQAMSFMGDTLNEIDAVCEEDVEYVTPAFEAVRAVLNGNSPVNPDDWVACSERMPDPESEYRICAYTPTPHEDVRFRFVPASLFKSVCRDATHWQYMLPPAAPQQGAS